jgi:hypothetical protein
MTVWLVMEYSALFRVDPLEVVQQLCGKRARYALVDRMGQANIDAPRRHLGRLPSVWGLSESGAEGRSFHPRP